VFSRTSHRPLAHIAAPAALLYLPSSRLTATGNLSAFLSRLHMAPMFFFSFLRSNSAPPAYAVGWRRAIASHFLRSGLYLLLLSLYVAFFCWAYRQGFGLPFTFLRLSVPCTACCLATGSLLRLTAHSAALSACYSLLCLRLQRLYYTRRNVTPSFFIFAASRWLKTITLLSRCCSSNAGALCSDCACCCAVAYLVCFVSVSPALLFAAHNICKTLFYCTRLAAPYRILLANSDVRVRAMHDALSHPPATAVYLRPLRWPRLCHKDSDKHDGRTSNGDQRMVKPASGQRHFLSRGWTQPQAALDDS